MGNEGMSAGQLLKRAGRLDGAIAPVGLQGFKCDHSSETPKRYGLRTRYAIAL